MIPNTTITDRQLILELSHFAETKIINIVLIFEDITLFGTETSIKGVSVPKKDLATNKLFNNFCVKYADKISKREQYKVDTKKGIITISNEVKENE